MELCHFYSHVKSCIYLISTYQAFYKILAFVFVKLYLWDSGLGFLGFSYEGL